VFRAFRRLIAAQEGIQAGHVELAEAVHALAAAHRELAPATERLDALELSRHQFEAMCEGLLSKAEGKLRAASNAEARERAQRKSYEHLLDPLVEDGERPETTAPDPVRSDDADANETERMHALRLDVAPNPKAFAQRAKFGVRNV